MEGPLAGVGEGSRGSSVIGVLEIPDTEALWNTKGSQWAGLRYMLYQ